MRGTRHVGEVREEQGASDAACNGKQTNTDGQHRSDKGSEDQNQEQQGHRKGDHFRSVQIVLEGLVEGLIDRHLAGRDHLQRSLMDLAVDLVDVALRFL